jgi:hypothetical protein
LFPLRTHLLSEPLEVSGRLKVSEKLEEPKEFVGRGGYLGSLFELVT